MFKELKLQDVFLIVIAHGRYWAQPVPGVDTFTLKTPSQICAASVWVWIVFGRQASVNMQEMALTVKLRG